MANFLYSAAMSLDGSIAGPRGDRSWLADYLGANPVVDELIPQTGAVPAGHRTFGGDDPYKATAITESRRAGDKYVNILGPSVAARSHAYRSRPQPLVSPRRIARASARTPVTICDSVRLA